MKSQISAILLAIAFPFMVAGQAAPTATTRDVLFSYLDGEQKCSGKEAPYYAEFPTELPFLLNPQKTCSAQPGGTTVNVLEDVKADSYDIMEYLKQSNFSGKQRYLAVEWYETAKCSGEPYTFAYRTDLMAKDFAKAPCESYYSCKSIITTDAKTGVSSYKVNWYNNQKCSETTESYKTIIDKNRTVAKCRNGGRAYFVYLA